MQIYFAPLEGLTGHIYRNAYNKLYGQIDKYFAPFISPCEKYSMIPKERKDLAPENNIGINLIPQILTSKSEFFINAMQELGDMGYKEVNLNLGCPSGTVCAKGKGAGFLTDKDNLQEFLSDIYTFSAQSNTNISIKTRLGYFNPEEIYELIDIFNQFPVSELIIHPRIRGDFYKGEPRYEFYSYALEHAKCPLVYNGNIFSKIDYNILCKKINHTPDTVMLGRGLISNPSLTDELLTGNTNIDYQRFWELHDLLYEEYKVVMSPDINILYRMKELWTYWRSSFDGIDREIKQLLKVKKCSDYDSIINSIRH